MDKELFAKIIGKRQVVSVIEGEQLPKIVRAKVTYDNRDYRNPKRPTQIGILNFNIMTDYHINQAHRYIQEGELQLAANCQCTKSVFEGEYFPTKGTYVDVSLDYVEITDNDTGEISQALMVVGVQAPQVSKTESALNKLNSLLKGVDEVENNIFGVKKTTV